MRTYLIINMRNKTYVETNTETFDGDWKTKYPHVAKEDYVDIYSPSIWEHDMVHGIPFVYDLCCDGGMFTLLTDVDKFSKEQIKNAVSKIRGDRDVVSLTVLRLKKV